MKTSSASLAHAVTQLRRFEIFETKAYQVKKLCDESTVQPTDQMRDVAVENITSFMYGV